MMGRAWKSMLAIALGGLLLASCGARTGLQAGPPAPPEPECFDDSDCEGSGDLCAPVICVLDLPPLKPGGRATGRCVEQDPVDCDDNDPCTQDDCDAETGLCLYSLATFDNDGDGFRGPLPGTVAREPGSCGDDCNDTSDKAYPGGIEVCDGVDNDCNGIVDDNASFVPQNLNPVQVSITESEPGGLGFNGSSFLSVFTNLKPASMKFTLLDAAGNILPPQEQKIPDKNSDTYGGPVVWTGNQFGIAWMDRADNDYEIYFNRLDPAGKKFGPDLRLTFAPDFSINVSLAWSGQAFYLTWQDRRDGLFNIYGQRVDPMGNPIGQNVPLTSVVQGFDQEAPSAAWGTPGLGVAWRVGNSSGGFVLFQMFDQDLAPIFKDPVAITDGFNSVEEPVIVWNKDRFVIAWSVPPGDESGVANAIYAATVSPDGTIIVPPTAITSPTPGDGVSRFVDLKPLGDRLLAVYQDNRDDLNSFEIYGRMVDADLVPITPEERITFTPTSSEAPVSAFGAEGDVGILYQDKDAAGQQQAFFTRLGCVTAPE